MADYRLYFLDNVGAIQAREEFQAPNDAEACTISGALADACSEEYPGYEIWSLRRCVFSTRVATEVPSLRELSRRQQEQVLDLEHGLQRSHWKVAKNRRLIEKTAELEALLEEQTAAPRDRRCGS